MCTINTCKTCSSYSNGFCTYQMLPTKPDREDCGKWEDGSKYDKVTNIIDKQYALEDVPLKKVDSKAAEQNYINRLSEIVVEEESNYEAKEPVSEEIKNDIESNFDKFVSVGKYLYTSWKKIRDYGICATNEIIKGDATEPIISYINENILNWANTGELIEDEPKDAFEVFSKDVLNTIIAGNSPKMFGNIVRRYTNRNVFEVVGLMK